MIETICWDCVYAGQCKKPINGWIAMETTVGEKYICGKSYVVISCPLFTVEKPKIWNEKYLGKPVEMDKKEIKSREYKSESEILTKKMSEYLDFLERKGCFEKMDEKYRYRNAKEGKGTECRSRKVIATNKNTGEVREYNSMGEATELGMCMNTLRKVLNGKQEDYEGWKLRFAEDEKAGKSVIARKIGTDQPPHG